jgi:hypothetical protein
LSLKILIIVISIIVVIALALPSILNLAGLHPKFDGNSFDLKGKKALIIATNHGILNKPGETDGKTNWSFSIRTINTLLRFQKI